MGAAAMAAGAVLIGSGGFALGTVSATSDAAKTTGFTSAGRTPTANDLNTGLAIPNPTNDKAVPLTPSSIGGGFTAALSAESQAAHKGVVLFSTAHSYIATGAGAFAKSAAYAYNAAGANPVAAANGLLRAVGAHANTKYNRTLATYVGGSAGRVLSVRANGLLGFVYSDSNLSTGNCGASTGVGGAVQPMYNSVNGAGNSVTGACIPVTATTSPSRSAALVTSQKVLTATGLSAQSYRWVVGAPSNGYVSVTAVAKVGGKELVNTTTSLDPNWQFTVVAGNKVSRVSGALAPVVSLGDYKIVSATAGVARLNDSTYRAQTSLQGAPDVIPVLSTSVASGGVAISASPEAGLPSMSSGSARLPAAPTPGSKVAWPVTNVSITKVGLSVAPYLQPNGAVVVMPTYVMTASDGTRYYVIAVDSASLDTGAP
jgi:hypothetical protein